MFISRSRRRVGGTSRNDKHVDIPSPRHALSALCWVPISLSLGVHLPDIKDTPTGQHHHGLDKSLATLKITLMYEERNTIVIKEGNTLIMIQDRRTLLKR